MKKSLSMNGNGNGHIKIGRGGVLQHSYRVWRRLQHGQEKVIRWSQYVEFFGEKIRSQNGHEHRCSVGFLFTNYLMRIRPYVDLDELLLTRCIDMHDVSEGIREKDILAHLKKDKDDLAEYRVFKKLMEPLGKEIWIEMQKCFLPQFCLSNPPCFPDEAREVMAKLANEKRNEALFFDGVQRLDYLYYVFECHVERKISLLSKEVTPNQFVRMDEIADELPGFSQVVWTSPVREFFEGFKNQGILAIFART